MQGVRGGSSDLKTIDFTEFSINSTFDISIVEKPMIDSN